MTGGFPEHYDGDWRPLLDYNRDHPDDQFRPFGRTPGHSFEWARLLIALEAALTEPPAWLLEAAVGTVRQRGQRRAGRPTVIPASCTPSTSTTSPVVTQRLHWVVCEAVLAADSLHRRTRTRGTRARPTSGGSTSPSTSSTRSTAAGGRSCRHRCDPAARSGQGSRTSTTPTRRCSSRPCRSRRARRSRSRRA